MPQRKNSTITPYGGGFVRDLSVRVKLILRLLTDRRVNPLIKLIPIGSFFYLIFPDFAPGPIDDAAIIWLGTYVFVELCPRDVVEEHMANLTRGTAGDGQNRASVFADEDIIEGEYREEV